MAVSCTLKNPVNVSADRLCELMLTPAAQQKFHYDGGAIEARCTKSEQGERVQIELYLEEPSREGKGKGSDKGTMTMQWNVAARSCTWERVDHNHGKLAKVTGEICIVPLSDERCTLSEKVTLDIKIPLLGNRIAKKVVKELEATHPQTCKRWEQLSANI